MQSTASWEGQAIRQTEATVLQQEYLWLAQEPTSGLALEGTAQHHNKHHNKGCAHIQFHTRCDALCQLVIHVQDCCTSHKGNQLHRQVVLQAASFTYPHGCDCKYPQQNSSERLMCTFISMVTKDQGNRPGIMKRQKVAVFWQTLGSWATQDKFARCNEC